MRVRNGAIAAAATLVCAAGLTACGSDDDSGSTSTAASGSSSAPAAKLGQAELDHALEYTAGTAGKADPAKKPVTIGWVNQEGGTPGFGELTVAADVAVKFINDELGGIGGHPLELEKCIIQSEEDGQRCGTQFKNNKDIALINLGTAAVGTASLYKVLDGSIPVTVGVPGAAPDFTTPHVYELDGGGAGVLAAMESEIVAAGHKSIADIYSSNPAGKYTAEKLFHPALEKRGVKPTGVGVPDAGTTPDFVSAYQAAGTADKDAISLIPSGGQCIPMYDALKQLNLTSKPVYTTYFCYGDPLVKHLGGKGPENWIFNGLTTNPRVSGNQDVDLYRAVMTKYDKADGITVGSAPSGFANTMTAAKWANEIGPDKLTPAAVEKKITDFRGPQMLYPGKIHCGQNKEFIGVCGDIVAASTYKDGKWIEVPSPAPGS